jgi:hypothetical protein
MSEELRLAIRARELGYRPYEKLSVNGHVLEAISFPFPEGGKLYIMARDPGDPTTLERWELPEDIEDYL